MFDDIPLLKPEGENALKVRVICFNGLVIRSYRQWCHVHPKHAIRRERFRADDPVDWREGMKQKAKRQNPRNYRSQSLCLSHNLLSECHLEQLTNKIECLKFSNY